MNNSITVVKLSDHINAINIGKPKILGNPFVMKNESNRDEVCSQYEQWLTNKIQTQDKRILRELYRLAYYYRKHNYLKLGCYCAPKRCHGDSIKLAVEKILDTLNNETVIQFEQHSIQGYEVSSIGDKRVSPLFARLNDGRTIEEHYQCDIKGYNLGGTNWRQFKRLPPMRNISKEQVFEEYKSLWEQHFSSHFCNLDLEDFAIEVLNVYNGRLHDTFATSAINQANAIAGILNSRFEGLMR